MEKWRKKYMIKFEKETWKNGEKNMIMFEKEI